MQRNSDLVGEEEQKEGNSRTMSTEAKVTSPSRKQRKGRGFSRKELREAGSDRTEALKLSIPFDEKRKTAHPENVKAIEAFLSANRPTPRPIKKKRAVKS